MLRLRMTDGLKAVLASEGIDDLGWLKKSDCLRLMSTCPFIDGKASSLYLNWVWANHGYPFGLMSLVQLKPLRMLKCRLTLAMIIP